MASPQSSAATVQSQHWAVPLSMGSILASAIPCVVPGGLRGKEPLGKRVQELPGKGKPGLEQQLRVTQTRLRVAPAVTQARERQFHSLSPQESCRLQCWCLRKAAECPGKQT